METSLFRYIWKHSRRDQIVLLLITLLTFPILYVSLELPKRIINDAIEGSPDDVTLFGVTLTQIEFLLVLCAGFLLAVLINGLLKMRLNTLKGVLAERLLRRFRYQLINRITRFPRPYFRHTSQGELVSMVTSEAEPMGGLMGDMLAQPVFKPGSFRCCNGRSTCSTRNASRRYETSRPTLVRPLRRSATFASTAACATAWRHFAGPW